MYGKTIIGASLSEPHTREYVENFLLCLYICLGTSSKSPLILPFDLTAVSVLALALLIMNGTCRFI